MADRSGCDIIENKPIKYGESSKSKRTVWGIEGSN